MSATLRLRFMPLTWQLHGGCVSHTLNVSLCRWMFRLQVRIAGDESESFFPSLGKYDVMVDGTLSL